MVFLFCFFLHYAFANEIIDEVRSSSAHWVAGENSLFEHLTIEEGSYII
jgi:hypothetical protein